MSCFWYAVEVFIREGTCLYMTGTSEDNLGIVADDLGICFFNLAKGGIYSGIFEDRLGGCIGSLGVNMSKSGVNESKRGVNVG